ncbi:MAG: M1 family metallopeptidase [Flavobacteriaceae bacterium]
MKYLYSKITSLFIVFLLITKLSAQPNPGYWQQHVDYTMEIDMNVETNQYQGVQKLVYTNNSPDVLNRVFYHLYFNAFQPGSEMDARSLASPDPDSRIGDRISKLNPDEIGYIKVLSLKQNGVDLDFETVGTILEVNLASPIQPGEQTTFDMIFNAQVPIQIRRSGRNNSEGVALSMAQWYPKLAEYDFEGWHADPYIEREFHGVWGDFDVKISIDKDYTIGGTGYLQNPEEVGHGYSSKEVKHHKGKKLTWHFVAPNVHDFTWAADPEYIHDTAKVPDGPTIHFFYKSTMAKGKLENWENLQPKAVELMQFFSENIGEYPYEQYSIIQGGDGGMEYGMCTLIVGEGSFNGLFGVTAHEMAHSWFQFLLATNELKYYWMDEGFTEYYGELAESVIFNKDFSTSIRKKYNTYIAYAKSGVEQPQTTQADRFFFRRSYTISSYYKGYIFLSQLGYIIGQENFNKTIKKYYKDFKFKHPVPNDIMRTAEKVSGLDLEWYLIDWTQTTNNIDYGIKSVEENNGVTTVNLERIGLMPMPLDIQVEYADGSKELFYIPLQMMRGEKPSNEPRTVLKDWAWAYPAYGFTINRSKEEIKSIVIDPKGLMADINRVNNKI